MDTVYLFFESENVRIPLYDYDKGLFTQLVKSNMGHWEKSERQYHISRSGYDTDQFKEVISGRPFVEVGKEADNPVVVNWFSTGGQPAPEETEADEAETAETRAPGKIYPGMVTPADDLPEQFPDYWREKLEIEMRARKYSRHTRAAYINNNKALCRCLQKPPEKVTTDDIKRYLAYLEQKKQQSAATLNSNLSAFKFFYGSIMKRDIARDQHRPRQDVRLPVVLARAEVKRMLDSEPNIKHRLILMMVYASGLRVSEVVKMRRQNVDLIRKIIKVVGGKGRRDRDTIMSDTVKETLKLYYTHYNITDWLFPGNDPAGHLNIRSAQKVCKNAMKKANIEKNASMHSLRHTFATHLLESGIDITQIGRLLGHRSIHTTARYTHVAKQRTLKITSPLDMIDKRDEDEEKYEYED
jgi:site-specific recombinase XerD